MELAATAVNRADLLQRMGMYPGPPMPREIPGLEFAGTVAEIGERVVDRSVGDRVMGIVGGGAYAEQLVVHERQTMRVPDGVGLADAAAIPEVAITAYDALVLQGGLTAGGWALVHAGGSGVGTAAIQLARAVGARVAVTCSAGKVDRCRELGADVVVDYSEEDFVAAVRGRPDGAGVDVVLDVIGGDYVARNLKACRVGGSIVQVGVMGGGTAEVPVGPLLSRRIRWVGTVLRGRPIEEKIAVTSSLRARSGAAVRRRGAPPGDRFPLPPGVGCPGPGVRGVERERGQGPAHPLNPAKPPVNTGRPERRDGLRNGFGRPGALSGSRYWCSRAPDGPRRAGGGGRCATAGRAARCSAPAIRRCGGWRTGR